MKVMAKMSILLLMALLLVAFDMPASAVTCTTAQSGCQDLQPSAAALQTLIQPSSNNYQEKNKLMYEICKTQKNIKNYNTQVFGAGIMSLPRGAGASKTMTLNRNGTWHIVITVNVPSGYKARVDDYLFNLRPISGSFNIKPAIVKSNFIEWTNLGSGTQRLVFDARQVYPGWAGDQGSVYYYKGTSTRPSGFLLTNPAVGMHWFK